MGQLQELLTAAGHVIFVLLYSKIFLGVVVYEKILNLV
jgi:hypothetical protein